MIVWPNFDSRIRRYNNYAKLESAHSIDVGFHEMYIIAQALVLPSGHGNYLVTAS
jgi:hypothetical protein